MKNVKLILVALTTAILSANAWADCTVWENCTVESWQNNDGTITIIERVGEEGNYKKIIQDSGGNQISAELYMAEGNITIPSEMESFSYTPDDYAERYTTIHYGTSDDDIIDKTISYWGTGDNGKWGMTETYNGNFLVTKSADWASERSIYDENCSKKCDPIATIYEGEKIEITYTYDDDGNLISSIETRYAMNDDGDWEQASTETKNYEVSKPVKRIYTVQEATEAFKALKTSTARVSLRYK